MFLLILSPFIIYLIYLSYYHYPKQLKQSILSNRKLNADFIQYKKENESRLRSLRRNNKLLSRHSRNLLRANKKLIKNLNNKLGHNSI